MLPVKKPWLHKLVPREPVDQDELPSEIDRATDIERFVRAFQMLFHRLDAQAKFIGHLLLLQPNGDETGNGELARGQF